MMAVEERSQRKVVRSESIGLLLRECEYVHRKVHANLAISSLDSGSLTEVTRLPSCLLCAFIDFVSCFPPQVISFLLLHPSLLYILPEE